MNGYGVMSGDDVELINSVPDGYQGELEQLTAGPLGLRVEWVDLPGVSIQKHRVDAALHWEEQRTEEGLSLAILLKADGNFHVRGVEFTPDDVLLQPFGVPLEYVTRPHMTALAVQVSPSLAESMGWALSKNDPLIFRTSVDAMRAFAGICCDAVKTAREMDRTPIAPGKQLVMRDRILDCLAPLLEPWQGESPIAQAPAAFNREYVLVKRAENWVAARDPEEKLVVAELADAMHVSMRSLHRAFATWTGVSPGRYFSLHKLHEFRKHLAIVRDGAPVTRAAMDTGFEHLGRLAGDYKKLFGETPSESLHRWERENRSIGPNLRVSPNGRNGG